MKHLAAFSALLVLLAAGNPSIAQERGEGTRPIRLVLPAGPGSTLDTLTRAFVEKLSPILGRAMVVDNMPGTGGAVSGVLAVTKAVPDGSTLLLGESGGLSIAPAMMTSLPYDPIKDLQPITEIAIVPSFLAVNASQPIFSLADFVKAAKERPGQITYGSFGTGSIIHLTMATFAAGAGIDLVHVPYRSAAAYIPALVNGEIASAWAGFVAIPQVRSGALRALAVSVNDRLESLPEVRTVAEQGFSPMHLTSRLGLVAPLGVPETTIVRLQEATAKAVRDPDFRQRLTTLGMVLSEDGSAAYGQNLKEDLHRFTAAVRAAGLKPQ